MIPIIRMTWMMVDARNGSSRPAILDTYKLDTMLLGIGETHWKKKVVCPNTSGVPTKF
jgi:hypothetical protein